MNTEHEKYLLAGLIVAVTFHFIILYFIGWLNLAKRQQPEKVLMPVTMLFKPVTEVNTPKAHVAVKHMPRKLHEVKRHTGTIKTGHNKFLSSTSKSPSTAGFSVPQGGKVKAGTVMSHQGESARSTSVANNDLPPIPAFNPMPVIPQNLRTQRYSTSIRVEFIVDEQGAFTIRLLSTTGYDELDREVIATLHISLKTGTCFTPNRSPVSIKTGTPIGAERRWLFITYTITPSYHVKPFFVFSWTPR